MTVNSFFLFDTLVKMDSYCDYVPFVSTITNLVDIFEKCVLLNYKNNEQIKKNPYFKHLIEKRFLRCVLVIIPVIGNIVIAFIDHDQKKIEQNEKEFKQEVANLLIPNLPGMNDNESATSGDIIDEKIDYEKEKVKFLNHIKQLKSEEKPETKNLFDLIFKFKDDFDVMLEAVKLDSFFYLDGGDEIKKNKEIILATVQNNGNLLKDINTSELTKKELKEVVIAAVKKSGSALKYAKDFQDDEEVVHFAVNSTPYINQHALKFASPELQKKIQKKIQKKNKKEALQDSLSLQSIVYPGVVELKINDPAFIEEIKELMDEEDFVLFLVKKCGKCLKYASFELQKNEKFILNAIENNVLSLEYVVFKNFSFEQQRNIALQAIKKHSGGVAFNLLPVELKNDLEVIKNTLIAFGTKNQEDPNYFDLVMHAVNQSGELLEFASDQLKKNQMIVSLAVLYNGLALKFADGELQNNKVVVLVAVANNGMALEFASAELQSNYDVVSIALIKNGMALEFASPAIQADFNLVNKALSSDLGAEKFAKIPQAKIDYLKKIISKA